MAKMRSPEVEKRRAPRKKTWRNLKTEAGGTLKRFYNASLYDRLFFPKVT